MRKKYFYQIIFFLIITINNVFAENKNKDQDQDKMGSDSNPYANQTNQKSYKPKFQSGMIADSGGITKFPESTYKTGDNQIYGVVAPSSTIRGDNVEILKYEKIKEDAQIASHKIKDKEKEMRKELDQINQDIQEKQIEKSHEHNDNEDQVKNEINNSNNQFTSSNQSKSNINLILKSKNQKKDNSIPTSTKYYNQKKPKLKYKIKKTQYAALNMPKTKINKRVNHKIQVLPPNIAQRKYIKGFNDHLAPVEFEFEYHYILFQYISKQENNIIRSLVKKVKDINVVDENGNTLLMHAIYYRNYEAMMILLNNGIDVNMTNDLGYNALHYACYTANLNAIIILLDSGASINYKDDYKGNTCLFYATAKGNEQMIRYLIEKGANLDIINKEGMTIVDFALYSKNKEIINYLIKKKVIKLKEK